MNHGKLVRSLAVTLGLGFVVYVGGVMVGTLAQIVFDVAVDDPDKPMWVLVTRIVSVMLVGWLASYRMPRYELPIAMALGAMTVAPGALYFGARSSGAELLADVAAYTLAGLVGALPHFAYKKGHLKGQRTRKLLGWTLAVIGYPLLAAFALIIFVQMSWLQSSASRGTPGPFSLAQFAFFALLGTVGGLLAMTGNRMRRPSAEQVLDGGQPYVLYLRAFSDDALRSVQAVGTEGGFWSATAHSPTLGPSIDIVRSASRDDTFETALSEVVGGGTPVIAISKPGDDLPPLSGALRLGVAAEQWQTRVRDLLKGCERVLLLAGTGTGLQWEVRQALELARSKFLVALPPIPPEDLAQRMKVLGEILEVAGVRVPPIPEDPKFLFIDRDEARFVVARGGSQEAYRQAFELYRQVTRPDAALPASVRTAAP